MALISGARHHRPRPTAEARLTRKGDNQAAKLSFAGHALMDNRHGLLVDLRIAPATSTAERETALEMLDDTVRIPAMVNWAKTRKPRLRRSLTPHAGQA